MSITTCTGAYTGNMCTCMRDTKQRFTCTKAVNACWYLQRSAPGDRRNRRGGWTKVAFLILNLLSIGIALNLLLIPLDKLGRGFFSFHVGLSLIFEIAALALDRHREVWLTHAPFLAALVVLFLLFQFRKLRHTPKILNAAAAMGILTIVISVLRSGAAPVSGLIMISSAAVLGAVLVAMNLGHWYLVIRGLPFELLGKANRFFMYSLFARIACIACGGVIAMDAWKAMFAGAQPLWDTTLFLTVRVGFGLVAPVILAWMVGECVKIRSNQSATGILYVAVVFVLIGELSGIYFLLEKGVPL